MLLVPFFEVKLSKEDIKNVLKASALTSGALLGAASVIASLKDNNEAIEYLKKRWELIPATGVGYGLYKKVHTMIPQEVKEKLKRKAKK